MATAIRNKDCFVSVLTFLRLLYDVDNTICKQNQESETNMLFCFIIINLFSKQGNEALEKTSVKNGTIDFVKPLFCLPKKNKEAFFCL